MSDKRTDVSPEQEIEFCTLGMFIIDEIHYQPPTPPVSNIMGGAGTFAALGARLFSPPPLSKRVAWIVDAGSDFPSSMIPIINNWETSVLLRNDSLRLTTRGRNRYDAAQHRDFEYITPKLTIDITDLQHQHAMLLSKSFHLICSPLRCISLVTRLLDARKQINPLAPKPLIVWEPVPDSCIPSELLNLTNCLPYVNICSPNHTELLSLISGPSQVDPNEISFDPTAIEAACDQLLAAMPLQNYAFVVRSGANGVYIAKNGGRSRRPSRRPSPSGRARQRRPANHARGGLTPETDMEALFAGFDAEFDRGPLPIDPGTSLWLPAYYEPDKTQKNTHYSKISEANNGEDLIQTQDVGGIIPEAPTPIEPNTSRNPFSRIVPIFQYPPAQRTRVIDPTGAGNSFLGALAVGLARDLDLEEAICWGCVASSFVVEQVGVPTLSSPDSSGNKMNITIQDGGVEELWNGESVQERLNTYLSRVRDSKTHG